jgi:hypothetical protein
MTTPVHVNIGTDITEGRSTHMAWPPVPPGVWVSSEVPAKQQWAPGASKHKLTASVFHRKQPIALQGHDLGMGIPDEAPPILGTSNGYLVIIMAKSSRKIMFGASAVKAEGTAIGGATIPMDLPMLTCGDPLPLPTVFPQTNTSNTVLVGFSDQDLADGWTDIGDAVLIELVCFALDLLGLKQFGPGDAIGGVGGVDRNKTLLGAAVGLARSIERSRRSGWKEPISVKVESGGGVNSAGGEVKWTPATGEVEIVVEEGGGPWKGSAGAKRDKDGNWKGTGAVPPDLFD